MIFLFFLVGDVAHTEEEKGSRWVFWWGEDEPEEGEMGTHLLGCVVMIFFGLQDEEKRKEEG